MTYSIVARDPLTGKLGVAAATRWIAVGTAVAWVRAGVGAVATQSFVEISYGPESLEALDNGDSPEDALASLLREDSKAPLRQVAVIDARGRVSAYTGDQCVEYASHVALDGCCIQGNMLTDSGVIAAMVDRWESSAEKPFAHRLLDCLEAAELAGGDIRGPVLSATLLVASAQRFPNHWEGTEVNLRVDHGTDPIRSLREALDLRAPFDLATRTRDLLIAGDTAQAVAVCSEACAMVPTSSDLQLSLGIALLAHGELARAKRILSPLVRNDPDLLEYLKRLPDAGFVRYEPLVLAELEAATANTASQTLM